MRLTVKYNKKEGVVLIINTFFGENKAGFLLSYFKVFEYFMIA